MSERCVLLLGGSFDPVHAGHVALARYFNALLHPDELRLIPAGRPWQKPGMVTAAEHRVAMLRAAFAQWATPVVIDEQEIRREGPSYAVDTLQALRAELGANASIVMALGADQLLNLHTWRNWPQLFELAHLVFATRPGFDLQGQTLDPAVAAHLARRLGSPTQLRTSAHGLAFIATNLAIDMASTDIRQALASGDARRAAEGLPGPVLDYIQRHYLYQNFSSSNGH